MILLAVTLILLVLTVLTCAAVAITSVIRNPVDYSGRAYRALPVAPRAGR